MPRRADRRIRLLAACALVVSLTGCCGLNIPRDPLAVRAGDRCYIEDTQFLLADQLYGRYGTLYLVERHLREETQWKDCEVNEAIYRLRKVHRLP